jgi:Tfp pilus assembly protein PilE
MKNGFTLGETLIVVLLVGVLGWITWNQFDFAKAKSRDVGRKSDLGEVAKSIRLYYSDYGKLPLAKEINVLWGKQWIDKDYVYMKSVPRESYLDRPYCYEPGTDSKTFTLYAELENKSDPDCKKVEQKCGDNYYCFVDVLETVTQKQ